MKITVLAENTGDGSLPTEHGLSLYIETDSTKILFDTGQSGLFAENAERLGIDLREAEMCVLSHGHYDHGGGLGAFLRLNDTAPVYLSRYAFVPLYNGEKYIGLDPLLKESCRLKMTDGETELRKGITLFSCNDRKSRIDMGSGGLTARRNGETVPDDFFHEHYLLIEERGKRVLFSACSHKGIVNIEEWLRPDVMIGGFHLMKRPVDDRLIAYARMLDSFDTAYYTCHCTGEEQYRAMRPYIRRLHYLSTGMTLTL